jgi:hypothetical protein
VTIAAGSQRDKIVSEEECAARAEIRQGGPIVTEVTSQMGIQDQVAMCGGDETGRIGEPAIVHRRQAEPFQKTRLAPPVGWTWPASRRSPLPHLSPLGNVGLPCPKRGRSTRGDTYGVAISRENQGRQLDRRRDIQPGTRGQRAHLWLRILWSKHR